MKRETWIITSIFRVLTEILKVCESYFAFLNLCIILSCEFVYLEKVMNLSNYGCDAWEVLALLVIAVIVYVSWNLVQFFIKES